MTIWNPADKTGPVTLSGGNLIASFGFGSSAVRSDFSASTGKFYWEVTYTNRANVAAGICLSTSDMLSINATTSFVNDGGSVWVGTNNMASLGGSYADGWVLCIALDTTADRVWYRNGAAGQWNGSGTANPATGVGGLDISSFSAGAVPIFSYTAYSAAGGGVSTGNFGASAFVGAVPSGFTAGFQAIPNTTWNPSDKTASGSLSGGNLTFTSGTNSSVRTVGKQASGKYYFEYTMTTWTVSTTGVGVANANFVLSSGDVSGVNTAGITRAGNFWVNGVSQVAFGTRASGNIICIALDLDNKLIWCRIGAAGNWNNSAPANPATATGGFSIQVLNPDGRLLPIYGAVGSPSAADVITANFGASAFTGAVPSGFTAGFPDTSPPLIAANTQTALEEWVSPNAPAQATQFALEQWVAPLRAPSQATQVALEEWFVPRPDRMMTQVALEEWVVAGSSNIQRLATQVALEQWAVNPDAVPPVTPAKFNTAVSIMV